MKQVLGCIGLAVALTALAWAGDAGSCKCPVSGKKAKKSVSYAYNGGKVYFCCGSCCKKFAADPSKFAAKANHQLVATGQAKQKACPFSGGKAKSSVTCNIDGVDVAFCCKRCQGRVAKTPKKNRVNLVFNNGSFKKGFTVKKK